MKGEYRETNSSKEFISILDQIDITQCMLWQNIDGNRITYSVSKILIDQATDRLIITSKSAPEKIDKRLPLYVKLDYRGAMFKAKILSCEDFNIITDIPITTEIQAIELRAEKRKNFGLKSELNVSILLAHFDREVKVNTLQFEVVDISKTGICLIVSTQNKEFIDNCVEFTITHLGENKLKEPIIMIKKHSSDFRYKKRGKSTFAYKVGFELENKFMSDEFEQFLEKC